MMKDIIKHFNKENNFLTNQKAIGMREVFRGVVVKIVVALPLESITFNKKHNNILVKKGGRVL